MRADNPHKEFPRNDNTPANINKRPLNLSPMRKIKKGTRCSCRKSISYFHRDGRTTCIRCGGNVQGVQPSE